jgi:hypothetical protein
LSFKEPPMIEKRASMSRGARASKAHHEALDVDARLDLALGRVDDLSAYLDCIRGARYEALARKVMP